MVVLPKISIRLKFIILALIVLSFSIFSGLTFLHSENTIQKYRDLEMNFETNFSILHTIDDNLMQLIFISGEDSLSVDSQMILDEFNSVSDQFRIRIDELLTFPFLQKEIAIQKLINQVQIISKELQAEITQAYAENKLLENNASLIISQHEVIDKLYVLKNDIYNLIVLESSRIHNRLKANIIIVLSISIFIMISGIFISAFSIDRDLNKLFRFIKVLEVGGRPGKLQIKSGDEFQEISERLNNYLDKLESKILFLKSIGQETESGRLEPGREDALGTELIILADRLKMVQEEEKERQAVERKRSWKTDGIAQFGEILRSERENVEELSFRIIQKLVTYLKIEMGTLFLTADTDDEQQILESLASYAYDRRKYLKKSFQFGEGLPGTCAQEKGKIYINEVTDDYSYVISGVGQTKPKFVLLVPLKIEEEIFGVLELASFKELQEFELEFVDELAESIASTLAGVKTNEKTAALLKQSQHQAEKLLQQENEMKINMEELQKAQEESRKKESEITGILNAMNQSSLVAEFDMNGRFFKINDRFLILLESPREQILGKNHHEFAMVDKYSEEYKEFWNKLRNGEIISTEEKFKLYSGKEVWLQQTYTPILSDQGNVYKILNIAVDITHSKQQQDHLESQAAEITRKSLEMESLNDAVNSSIIKCELDQDGIILDLNDNYGSTTGFNRKELLGRNYRLFLKDIEKDQFEKIWMEVLKDKTYEGAIRRTKPTGEEIWLMSTFSPVKDESGVIYKIYFLALDITEKRLKYQLLEEANREVDRLREELQKYEG